MCWPCGILCRFFETILAVGVVFDGKKGEVGVMDMPVVFVCGTTMAQEP